MTDVAASVGMYVPLIDTTLTPAGQYRATVTSILSLVPAPSFASITGKPTTLAGYGIVDGITAAAAAAAYQPLDADLTAISALATTAYGRDLLVQVDAAAVRAYIGVGAGSGTVTSVGLVGTANQITVSGASPITTSGSFTLSFPAGGVTLPGTTTGTFSGALTGNASTATALQTARTINGTSFDGTANITVSAAAGTLTGATLAAGVTASSLLSAAGGSFGTAAFTASTDYQPIDADLTAIAALSTTAYGRDFLVQVDAAAARTYIGAGTGGGTVTSFSSGNLSPLFTTSVATATTTPALSFTISTQAANLVFSGPTSGGAVAPTFRSLVAADIPSLSSVYQPLDADLTAIAALATTGYARRTGSDAWTLDTSIPSASLTPPGLTTQLIYNNAGAFGAISTLTESGGILTKTRNALSVTTNDAFVIVNTTASTGGVQAQYSPALRWSGQAFDGDTSTDTQISFRAYVATFNGGSYSDALWTIESRVGSGGAWSFPMTYSTAGRLTIDSLTATGQVQASAIAGSQGSIDLSDVVSGVVVYSGLGLVVNGSAGFDFNPNDGDGSGFLNINGGLTLTTPLDETYGGTGLTSYAQGDLLYASAANTLAKLAKNTSATRYLSNTGASNSPAWAQVNLTNGVTGTLPVANGGTSFTGYTTGDMIYASAAGTLSKLAEPGLPGYVLSWAGGVPVATQLSTIAVTALVGTAAEITASSATGSVTLSLPSALTFTGKTVTGGTFNGGAFNGTLGATTPSTVAATYVGIGTASDSAFRLKILHTDAVTECVAVQGDLNAPALTDLHPHAYRDATKFTSAVAADAYASVDTLAEIKGSLAYNHFYGFQARHIHNGSGLLDAMAGFVYYPTHVSGSSTTISSGLLVYDSIGTGSIDINCGVYINALSRGTANWGIYTDGTTPSYFGGAVSINTTAIVGPGSTGGGRLRIRHNDSGPAFAVYDNSDTQKFRIDSAYALLGTGWTLSNAGAMTLSSIDQATLGANTPSTVAATTIQATTSVLQGGGMKHQRVTTGSIGAGSTALVTLTWTTTFSDSNYTAVASVVEATTSSLSLSVVHIESVSASAVAVRIINNAVGSLTGELQVIAMHD